MPHPDDVSGPAGCWQLGGGEIGVPEPCFAAGSCPFSSRPPSKALLKPAPESTMGFYRVWPLINSSRNEGAELVEPIEA